MELSGRLDQEGKGGLASQLRECVSLNSQRLWHQLSLLLEPLLKERDLAAHVMAIHESFIDSFAEDLNQIRFVQMSVLIALHAQPRPSDAQRIDFLKGISERPHVAADKPAQVLAKSLYASALLHSRALASASASPAASSSTAVSDDVSSDALAQVKQLIGELSKQHGKLRGAPKCVDAAYYRLLSEYHLGSGPAEAFLENGLMYLAHQELDEIPRQERHALATDLCLASLCGDKTYNFGELLSHSILDVLTGTADAWLVAFLDAFNRGDIAAYNQIARESEPQLLSHPSLLKNRQLLRRKIQILGLMELIFKRDRDHRVLSFSEVAAAAELPVDQVEHLIIKALSLKLVKGSIDQVEGKVAITWVQPRVLTLDQISSMKGRLDDWTCIVSQTLVTLESQSQDIVN